MISHISLDLFAVVWNQSQGQTTPAIHLRILRWLETSWHASDTRLLLMAFRSCGKSTLVGIFAAWLLYRNPNLRIMVVAADTLLARKMVRNVKRILERHPLTPHLKPQHLDQWAGDRFTVVRDLELRDPSMLARGVTSNITGSRADMIIYDDVEVPNTAATLEKRDDLRDRLTESTFILSAGGTQLYVGTPHHYDTIYAVDQQTQNADQSEAFLDGFSPLRVPLLNDKDESQWPDRFSRSMIERLKRQVGPNRFASQMMLQPTNSAEGRLNPAQLRFYDGDMLYREVQQKPVLSLNETPMVSCSAWWDPAFGAASGDASVLAIVFADTQGNYYLHHLAYIRITQGHDDDEATQQCRQVAEICRRFYVPCVHVEINGIGRFLPAILKREMRKARVGCAVVEQSSRIPKAQRILEGFDAVMAARALFVHASVKATPFLTEMREWRPTTKNGHDDGLDAVAGALSQEPVRIGGGKYVQTPRPQWHGNATIFQAIID